MVPEDVDSMDGMQVYLHDCSDYLDILWVIDQGIVGWRKEACQRSSVKCLEYTIWTPRRQGKVRQVSGADFVG